MAQTLTDCGIWISGIDFSGISNQVGANFSADTPTKTTFKSGGWVERAGGLQSASFSLEGYFDVDEAELFDSLGAERSVMVVPASYDAGSVAYIIPVAASAHNVGGALGDILPWQYAAEGDGKPCRAGVFDIREGVTIQTDTAPRILSGAIASGDSLKFYVHAARQSNAGTLGVSVHSSLTVDGALTQRGSESITDTGLTVLSVDGAVPQSYWELRYTPSVGSEWDAAVAMEMS